MNASPPGRPASQPYRRRDHVLEMNLGEDLTDHRIERAQTSS